MPRSTCACWPTAASSRRSGKLAAGARRRATPARIGPGHHRRPPGRARTEEGAGPGRGRAGQGRLGRCDGRPRVASRSRWSSACMPWNAASFCAASAAPRSPGSASTRFATCWSVTWPTASCPGGQGRPALAGGPVDRSAVAGPGRGPGRAARPPLSSGARVRTSRRPEHRLAGGTGPAGPGEAGDRALEVNAFAAAARGMRRPWSCGRPRMPSGCGCCCGSGRPGCMLSRPVVSFWLRPAMDCWPKGSERPPPKPRRS